MTKPFNNNDEVRAMMAYHFRRALEDELLKGQLPPELAQAVENQPDAVVELLINQLAPAVIKKVHPETPKSEIAKAPPLNAAQVKLLVLSLMSVQKVAQRHDQDMDTDGALLFCRRGMTMLKNGRDLDAVRHFRKAVEIKDTLKSAWQGMAQAQERLGDLEGADQSRNRAAQL